MAALRRRCRRHDRARALFPADVVAWVQASQPKAWETLTKNHGAVTQVMLLDRLRKQTKVRGTLEVLLRVVELKRNPFLRAATEKRTSAKPKTPVEFGLSSRKKATGRTSV